MDSWALYKYLVEWWKFLEMEQQNIAKKNNKHENTFRIEQEKQHLSDEIGDREFRTEFFFKAFRCSAEIRTSKLK